LARDVDRGRSAWKNVWVLNYCKGMKLVEGRSRI